MGRQIGQGCNLVINHYVGMLKIMMTLWKIGQTLKLIANQRSYYWQGFGSMVYNSHGHMNSLGIKRKIIVMHHTRKGFYKNIFKR